ncbi:MAG: PAS domain S-box protein [Candidatus Hydrogenedentes bacterium]|nr:PAS domain S-box protein [Candidatus Hydrogenedentota bacterium]
MIVRAERTPSPPTPAQRALRIALLYALAASLWIVFSDRILLAWGNDTEFVAMMQTVKGLAFVVFTSLLVLLMVYWDTSSMQRAHDKLSLSEQRFRTCVDQFPYAFLMLDAERRIQVVNAVARSVIGKSDSAILGKRSEDVLKPEVSAAVSPLLEDTYARHTRQQKECVLILGGQEHTYFFDCVPVLDDKGDVLQVLCVGRDMTQRKKAEVERAMLITAIENAAEAVFMTDLEGKIEYANPAFSQITGYAPEEAVGMSTSLLKSGKQDERFYGAMWESLRKGDLWHGRFVNKRKDNSLYEWNATISPVRDSEGRLAHFVSVTRDVTAEVALERQLQQAQKLEAIGTLAGGIAHDFNNILAAVMGYAEMALQELEPNMEAYADVKKVLQASSRATALVRQLLTFSRQMEERRVHAHIDAVAHEALTLLRALIPASVEIKEVLGGQDGYVFADISQLQQVIVNLCTNAYQAMVDGKGQIELSTRLITVQAGSSHGIPDLQEGQHVVLAVKDTGIGIDSNNLERIFDPFFTTKEMGKGSGLGLSTVHGIVRAHGGILNVKSELGVGSVFEVWLPAVKAPENLEHAQQQQLTGRSECILVVDDEEILAELLCRQLERFGYRVVMATDSEEALRLFRENPRRFDLLITDQNMPQLTGMQLSQEVLRLRKGLPIILATGYSVPLTREEATSLGIRAYLNKPIEAYRMAQVVRQVLDEACRESAT